jgi:hypothetical protein
LSSDLEIPHKILKEVFAEEFDHDKEVKSKSILSHKNFVTPTSQMPTSTSKFDMPYTSIKGSKHSYFEPSDHTSIIENLQQENAQLLQQLEEQKTMEINLHHDNLVLQKKMNYLQRFVDQVTSTNRNL